MKKLLYKKIDAFTSANSTGNNRENGAKWNLSMEMLKCLNSRGHLCTMDVDPIELAKTQERLVRLGYAGDAKADTPAGIAVSIMAQMIQYRNQKKKCR